MSNRHRLRNLHGMKIAGLYVRRSFAVETAPSPRDSGILYIVLSSKCRGLQGPDLSEKGEMAEEMFTSSQQKEICQDEMRGSERGRSRQSIIQAKKLSRGKGDGNRRE